MKIKVEKTSDNRFDGNHPNFGSENIVRVGLCHRPPTVGISLAMITGFNHGFQTSDVTAVRDGEFDTLNSTYKFTILEP